MGMASFGTGWRHPQIKLGAIPQRPCPCLQSPFKIPSWAHHRHVYLPCPLSKKSGRPLSWPFLRQTHLWSLLIAKNVIRASSVLALDLKTHLPQTLRGDQETSHDRILAFCEQCRLDEALHALLALPSSAPPPSDQVYLSLLKLCKREKCLEQARRIHNHLINHPIKKVGNALGTQLIVTIMACGGAEFADEVYREFRGVITPSSEAIISGYLGCGKGRKALEVYFQMRQSQIEPHFSTLVNLIKVCGRFQDLKVGRILHFDVIERGYDNHIFVSSILISMYGKCGSLLDAEKVFAALSERNVVSCNSLLASYIENEDEETALRLYRQMQEEGQNANHLTFVAVLQACGTFVEKNCLEGFSCRLKLNLVLDIGRALHADAHKGSFISNEFVESTLLSMYKKCGLLAELEAVFSSSLERNVVSWNVMLSAYVDQGLEKKALQLYKTMLEEGVIPDHQTMMVALLACGNLSEKEQANETRSSKEVPHKVCQALYHDARQRGLAGDVILGSMFINVFGKCGEIVDAEGVFGRLATPDIAAWNSMLSAYAQRFQEEKALTLYHQMCQETVCWDGQTLVAVLQACGSLAGNEETGDHDDSIKLIGLEIGEGLHSIARKHGLESVTPVANTLISMYGKCARLEHAEAIFVGLVKRDIVSWNAMLSAYAEQEQFDLVLQLYWKMRNEGFSPDRLTIAVALQACEIAAEKEGISSFGGQSLKQMSHELVRTLHSEAAIRGFESNKHLRSRLISTYGLCGAIFEAENVFLEACQPDTCYWNVMLTAYIDYGLGDKALQLYKLMQEDDFVDKRTMVIILKACGSRARIEETDMASAVCLEVGQALHAYAWNHGLDSNVFVGSALINMYGKCGYIERAKHVFGRMPRRDTVLWNAMLFACVEHGEAEGALQLFSMMQREHARFDLQTLTIALQACCNLAEKEKAALMNGHPTKVRSLRIGKALHLDAIQSKVICSDVAFINTLVNMYGKCGAIREAEKAFNCLCERSTTSWNAMLSAYIEYEYYEKAVQFCQSLLKNLMDIDDVTIMYTLQACSQMGDLEACKQVHFIAVFAGVDLSFLLSTTLVHTYGNCGCMVDAETVFHELTKPDVVLWSTCVCGFAQQGQPIESFLFFDNMHMEGVVADDVACSAFLFACSHAGLVYEGTEFFNSMEKFYGVSSTVMHYANVLDLLARTGNLAKVDHILQRMPMKPDLAIWMCVLSACSLHGNLELAKVAFTSAAQSQPVDSAGYVLMSNIYRQLDAMEGD